MYMDWHGWGMGGGWLLMVLFWTAVIALIVFLVRKTGGNGVRSESAMDILKKRYAKGEITKDDYERMKKEIEGP